MRKMFLGAVGIALFLAIVLGLFIVLPDTIIQQHQWPMPTRILILSATALLPVVLASDRFRVWVALCTFRIAGVAAVAISRGGPIFGVSWLKWIIAAIVIAPAPLLLAREIVRQARRRRGRAPGH